MTKERQPSYKHTLDAEIDAVIQRKMESGEILQARWIAQEICSSHQDGLAKGDDADFWYYGGWRTCRDAVTDRIGKIKERPRAVVESHPTLPGFEHVQTHYVVERDGEEVGVPVDLMSDDEIERQANFLDAMGATCLAHARELRRYKRLRTTAA